MIALFLVGLSGGGLVAGLVHQRKSSTLIDKLRTPPQRANAQASEAADVVIDHVRSKLSHLDDHYQTFVQTHLDPLLVSELREEQMRQVSQTNLRKLNAQERANNRRLALGVAGLAVLGVKILTRWPLTPIVLIIGLYNGWPWLKESWRIAVGERRLSLLHLLVLYLLSLWLGGHYLIGMIGITVSLIS
jgi:hypothetical protein